MHSVADRLQDVTAALFRPLARIRGTYRVCRIFNRVFLVSGASPIKTTCMIDNTLIALDLRSHGEWYPFYSGRYDEAEIELIKALLAEGGNFLDVGGNIGIYAIRIGRSLAKTRGRVYCFEPVPSNHDRIAQNIGLNGLQSVIALHDVALSSATGTVEMTLREDFCAGAKTGNASVAISDEADGTYDRIAVRCITFDEARHEFGIGPISVLKIDIEGHEDHFLIGAAQMLSADRPVIFTELNAWYFDKRGVRVDDVIGGALPYGYLRCRVKDVVSGDISLLKTFDEVQGTENIVLCPEERMEELRGAVRGRIT